MQQINLSLSKFKYSFSPLKKQFKLLPVNITVYNKQLKRLNFTNLSHKKDKKLKRETNKKKKGNYDIFTI